MKRTNPPLVLQPAANQRLSCRKITCKAFPFVVEKQRVTSYFFLVKKKSCRAAGDLVDLSLDSFLFFLLPVAGCRGPCCAPCGLSLLFAGVTWWKRLAEITEKRGSPLEQESKSVGCLLRWLWMFSAAAFYGSQSVALKGEGMYSGCLDFGFSVLPALFVLLLRWGHFSCQIKASVIKQQSLSSCS